MIEGALLMPFENEVFKMGITAVDAGGGARGWNPAEEDPLKISLDPGGGGSTGIEAEGDITGLNGDNAGVEFPDGLDVGVYTKNGSKSNESTGETGAEVLRGVGNTGPPFAAAGEIGDSGEACDIGEIDRTGELGIFGEVGELPLLEMGDVGAGDRGEIGKLLLGDLGEADPKAMSNKLGLAGAVIAVGDAMESIITFFALLICWI